MSADPYEISTDVTRLDRALIHRFLHDSYWAEGVPRDVVERAVERGLGKRLIEAVMAHPDLQGVRRFILGTADAHSLYERFGFRALTEPERMMEIAAPYASA